MEKNSKFKRKKLLILFTAVLVFVVAYVAYFLVLEYKIHSKAREIRNTGYPSNPEELDKWYLEPPSGQNAAEFYLEAFKNFVSKPENVDEKILIICGSGEIPAIGGIIPADVLENAKKYLLANRKAIDLLHKATALKTCRFPVELKDAERKLTYHSNLRQAAKLLYLDALVSAEQGDNAKAFESAMDSCRLASSLENEPLPDAFMVQMALEHIALDNVERLLVKGCFDEKQLKLIGQEISRFEEMKSLERAYAGERSLVLSEYYLEEFMEYAVYDFPGFVRKSHFLKQIVFFLFDASLLRMNNNLSCIGFLSELVELSKGKPEDVNEKMNKIDERIMNLPGYLFAVKIYMPHLCSITDKKILLVSRARAVRTAVAVESYRMKNGKIPEDLALLAPGYLDSIPVDPVNGRQVRYKKDDKGFVVYSTGADGQDNNGNTGSNRGFSQGEDFSVRIAR
ncbi:MAG TPA: hypothetical protein DCZ94_22700 [Lentisphaeria bacterium]|nr:MAG: hypothetical protein A2X48_13940 [Lentisphaerae bacterium GWF2_49_21]HBC89758.1 hypothetical protein [Lentisphaeria bacterium]